MPYKTKEQQKAWREKNKDAQKIKGKAYYEKNKDKIKVRHKVYRESNPQVVRDSQLRTSYDITLDDYNEMFTKQEGKCAICGNHQSEIKTVLAVDHCHSTGKVRGLLCGNCNRAIGLLKDDIENLRCAILYLNKND